MLINLPIPLHVLHKHDELDSLFPIMPCLVMPFHVLPGKFMGSCIYFWIDFFVGCGCIYYLGELTLLIL